MDTCISTARTDDISPRLFEEAAEEVEHERRWYRQRSESAEAAFLRELDQAIAAALEPPHIWSQYMAAHLQ